MLDEIFAPSKATDRPLRGWRTITEENPVFVADTGDIYGKELTRSVIERFANACSKLKPEYHPDTAPLQNIKTIMDTVPNERMTWPAFLARLATLHEVDSTVFIVPSFKSDMQTIDGLWPLKCQFAEVLEFMGEPWVRFTFANGQRWAIELKYVGIVSRFQYESDFFGEGNCLDSTLRLIDAQNAAQDAAIQSGAKIRFIGSLTGQVREEDMKKKRERFMADNFNTENTGGLMLYDQTFSEIRQIQPYNYTMDAAEMERIEQNVYTYFGTNKSILQNDYSEDVWGAYYEGKIEPWAVKVGEAITSMIFSPVQQKHGHRITFSANRLQYASLPSKRNMIRDMTNIGLMSLNEGREILQLSPIEGGDVRIIRGEYVGAETIEGLMEKLETVGNRNSKGRLPINEHEVDRDPGGDDAIYKDSDSHGKDDF
jgi:hypothetical protein